MELQFAPSQLAPGTTHEPPQLPVSESLQPQCDYSRDYNCSRRAGGPWRGGLFSGLQINCTGPSLPSLCFSLLKRQTPRPYSQLPKSEPLTVEVVVLSTKKGICLWKIQTIPRSIKLLSKVSLPPPLTRKNYYYNSYNI